MQFKAGYIVDTIAKVVNNFKSQLNSDLPADKTKLDQINGLLQYVSSFDVEFTHTPNFKELNPVLATLNNIITRGLPTRAPVFLEELFSDIGLTEPNKDEFEFNFPYRKDENEEIAKEKNEERYKSIFELLHIIEPDLEINRQNYGGNPGSKAEWLFLHEKLKDYPFTKQILQSQRDFATINHDLGGGKSVDFSFEFPYLNTTGIGAKRKGIIFEYDGQHHNETSYKYYDKYRDDAASKEGFDTLRQSSDKIELDSLIIDQFKKDIFKILENNFEKNIVEHRTEYFLIFIPLAVARIQKTILEYLLVHPELFKKEKIEIAIIERDLPCGAIAIKGLQDLIFNINAILEDADKLALPEISLTIFKNSKWVNDNRLHLQASVKDESFFNENNFDIILDHSILRRSNIYNEPDFKHHRNNTIRIRSAHYFDTSVGNTRRVYCANLLRYESLVEKKDDGSYIPVSKYESHINFFIQNIFRKVSFREGQLPIISRALQQKPVIGLLPTGGGKSLTFQLPTFLQPGLCLVVDPIKSLMEDQVRVLKENWIDCCDFINSNLEREEKTKKLIDFRYGETMFLFVSPERLVMQDFRYIIKNIDTSDFGLAFSYCVIDEVHCVSEWGHDFRTTYLMLGKNAQRFAKTKGEKAVSLIGLTATASFDVLADIERELQIQHHEVADAIIMIENTIRPELFFRVIDVTDQDRMNALNNDFEKFGSNLTQYNNDEILMQSLAHHYIEFENTDFGSKYERINKYVLNEKGQEEITPKIEKLKLPDNISQLTQNDFYAIIFCPVKGEKLNADGEWANKNGVRFVHSKLKSNSNGFFFASDDDTIGDEVHKHFVNFTTDKTKHMVCTKAFGMGIDKKDIRSTYHYVYSGSLESLVQEAGRSGRDQKISEANILISQSKYVKLDVYKFFSENKSHTLIQKKFTRKAIRQAFEKKWIAKLPIDISFSTLDEALTEIDLTDFSLLRKDGTKYNVLPAASISKLKDKLKEKDGNNHYKYLVEKYNDRNIHDFFYELSFKGVDTEKSQFQNLFEVKEFQLIKGDMIDIEKQDTLANTFNNCEEETFPFIITETKKHPDSTEIICNLLGVKPTAPISPPAFMKTFEEVIKQAYKLSHDFNDFLFLLEEDSVKKFSEITEEVKAELLSVYSRDRDTKNDTGRLIYRMHSMGLLVDYTIDYNKNNLYKCTFKKYNNIQKYIEIIESYLRRYLSEQAAIEERKKLETRLKRNDNDIVNDILECLYFLSEFSYKEIASKRKRATEEIESILNTSITEPNYVANPFQQNLYIKEQIYFYFNAKYARIGFKINGKPFSLLDDYQEMNKREMSKQEILDKYMGVYQLEGAEQNNYKHMMGSCKKILRSLSETDLNKEWLLRLLKAFSMYSVNNASYISEANAELELGFDNLYKDESFHKDDFKIIEPIFESYFAKLQSNIQEDNPSFKDIKLIRVKLLLKMQTLGIENLTKKLKIN